MQDFDLESARKVVENYLGKHVDPLEPIDEVYVDKFTLCGSLCYIFVTSIDENKMYFVTKDVQTGLYRLSEVDRVGKMTAMIDDSGNVWEVK